MLQRLLNASVRRLPGVNRMVDELGRLRAENADQRATIHSLTRDQTVLRERLARVRGASPNAGGTTTPPAAPVPSRLEVEGCFTVPLVDLGGESEKFAGVLCPEPELGKPKIGVSDVLLGGAETYFQKYEHFGYMFELLKRELDILELEPKGLAVDFGSGFGNTVIPLLENFHQLNIVATDISPDLLAILLREVRKRGLSERCAAVAFDAQNDYFVPGCADIVFGGAVLHHLIDPSALLNTAMKVLKPGGHAIFFEPFENWYSVLRLAYEEILRRAEASRESGAGFDFLRALAVDIAARTHRRSYPGMLDRWADLDDKWLFTPSSIERMCDVAGASSVRIHPFNAPDRPFTAQTRSALKNYAGLDPDEAIPAWAWDIVSRYDDSFSPEMRSELVIEGAVVITK